MTLAIIKYCGSALVIETGNVALVFNKRLEKAHIALRDLELGITLEAPAELVGELEKLLENKLKKLVVISEEVDEDDGRMGSC
jgi:hypothetical protein